MGGVTNRIKVDNKIETFNLAESRLPDQTRSLL